MTLQMKERLHRNASVIFIGRESSYYMLQDATMESSCIRKIEFERLKKRPQDWRATTDDEQWMITKILRHHPAGHYYG